MSTERGDFVVGDDGFTVFWPEGLDGALSPSDLRILADELDRLNEPITVALESYFRCDCNESHTCEAHRA